MKVKRIFAPDMRQAMRRAREEIGPDAVIVSNHRVAGGVEVVAAHEEEFEAAQAAFKRDQARQEARNDSTAGSSQEALSRELQNTRLKIAEANERMAGGLYQPEPTRNMQVESEDDEDLQTILSSLRERQKKQQVQADVNEGYGLDDSFVAAPEVDEVTPAAGLSAQPLDHHAANQETIVSMQAEIAQLKQLLETQQAQERSPQGKVWVEESVPAKTAAAGLVGKLTRRFEKIGLGEHVITQLTRGLESDLDVAKAWRVTLSKLTEAIPTMSEDYIDRGGMIAFVGPTGVGKTTTIGKLAARYVLQHGSAGLALVTTDCYRIAAHEQLRTFGRILDVPVRVVDENHTLDEVLMSLRGKRLVLIDTAGMSQHEGPSEAQKEMLNDVSVRLKKLLVLSCSSQRQVLEDAYDNYHSVGLNGCVLSKMDESGSLGEALTVAIERGLPIAYVTDGQKVPDDIEVAQRNELVSRAVVTAQKTLERERERARLAAEGGSTLPSAG
ncbi:flagellar biosynthesis protein FlhF [Neptunomonas sp. XY-337]|uniref:flagellar biosynthesis protein FlhF n=1 Tax=Neptunomonas sp. XY-337 TaxID=2561897 RepID=UPI0010A9FBC8|nr:flagellar biosynthesis protein FlhF [Neptunomonas sp. XY-337]